MNANHISEQKNIDKKQYRPLPKKRVLTDAEACEKKGAKADQSHTFLNFCGAGANH